MSSVSEKIEELKQKLALLGKSYLIYYLENNLGFNLLFIVNIHIFLRW